MEKLVKGSTTDQEFTFQVQLWKDSTNWVPLSGTYRYQIAHKNGDADSGTFTYPQGTNQPTFKLKDGSKLTIYDLPYTAAAGFYEKDSPGYANLSIEQV